MSKTDLIYLKIVCHVFIYSWKRWIQLFLCFIDVFLLQKTLYLPHLYIIKIYTAFQSVTRHSPMSLYFVWDDVLSASFKVQRAPLQEAWMLTFCEWRVSSRNSTTPNCVSSATRAWTSLSKHSAQMACTLSAHEEIELLIFSAMKHYTHHNYLTYSTRILHRYVLFVFEKKLPWEKNPERLLFMLQTSFFDHLSLKMFS